ncbi:MAG TPA: hypothetical protein VNB90_05090 [Cytophagaceae bacterium]|nr:hypothetical protein [Cytophagaceae bacterium]
MQNIKPTILSNEFYEIITNSTNDLSKEFMNELIRHKEELNWLLGSYYGQERGSVYDHSIDQSSIEIDKNGKGSFITNFDIYYALEGYTDKSKMKIEFQIDLKTKEIIFKGEDR